MAFLSSVYRSSLPLTIGLSSNFRSSGLRYSCLLSSLFCLLSSWLLLSSLLSSLLFRDEFRSEFLISSVDDDGALNDCDDEPLNEEVEESSEYLLL